MKQKIALIVISALVLTCLGGCGRRHTQNQNRGDPYYPTANRAEEQRERDSSIPTDRLPENPSFEERNNYNPTDGDSLFAGCTLSGTVNEFSNDGCKLTPTIQEGNTASQAAPGYEEESELVNIIYDEGCIFQIAYVNLVNGAVTYEASSTEDVKKQTSLIIYGTYDSGNNLVADHIYIYRSTEG